MAASRRLLAIADDLSGAAEVAAALHSRTTRSRVLLIGRPGAVNGGVARALRPRHPGEATVLDLDSRYRPATEAAEAVREALRLSSPDENAPDALDTLVLKKIDSLLRGNVAAEIAALAEGGAGVVLAPALPIAGRVVRSGVVHLGGVALDESDAWRAETLPPPASVAHALGGLPTALVPLTTVRASRRTLLTALRTAAAAGRVAICDAETDADLDAVVEAALAEGPRMRLVGSGGLALALGRHLRTTLNAIGAGAAPAATGKRGAPAADAAPAAPPAEMAVAAPPADMAVGAASAAASPASAGRPVLVVVGTAEPAAAEQVRRLVEDGAVHHQLPLAELLSGGAPVRLPPLTAPVTVVSLGTPSGAPDPAPPHGAVATDTAPLPSPRPAPETVTPAAAPGPAPKPAPGTPPTPASPSIDTADHTGPDRPDGQTSKQPEAISGPAPKPAPSPTPDTPPTPASPPVDTADRTEPNRPDGETSKQPGAVSGRRLVLGLARVIGDAVAAHHGAVDLVLTGGETARRVLDALAVAELDPVGQVHHGAVHLATPDGRSVVTRPGSFGDPDSLRQIVQALRPHSTERKVTP
ncbi:four-carbon acid sugar kinase family protein [Streptomyces malaysiensis]|uniref:four-carbon acid sugar kinase family protein n=1 Tax=Streptomyces malaysiensis TaxID=92644 RepID=UPI0032208B67|nr:four-carbon acid sugar kinase family protein [Streptomyces malaysiensis]